MASGLMLRTLHAIQNVSPGFTLPDQIQMVRISIPDALAKEPDRVIGMQKKCTTNSRQFLEWRPSALLGALPLEDNHNGVLVVVEGKTDLNRCPRMVKKSVRQQHMSYAASRW